MRSKFMAFLAAGLTLSAFTWISAAPPAEAQACHNNNYNNRRAFKRFKKFRRHQRRAVRNNNFNANVNPYFVRGNRYWNNNGFNPYLTNTGLWGSIRNLF